MFFLVMDALQGSYEEATKGSGFFNNEGKEGHTSGYHLWLLQPHSRL